jgi:hypothetical protein
MLRERYARRLQAELYFEGCACTLSLWRGRGVRVYLAYFVCDLYLACVPGGSAVPLWADSGAQLVTRLTCERQLPAHPCCKIDSQSPTCSTPASASSARRSISRAQAAPQVEGGALPAVHAGPRASCPVGIVASGRSVEHLLPKNASSGAAATAAATPPAPARTRGQCARRSAHPTARARGWGGSGLRAPARRRAIYARGGCPPPGWCPAPR